MSELTNFPSQKLPFKRKTKKWRKKHLDWADNNSYINNSSIRRKIRNKLINLNLYNGKADVEDMKLILNPGGLEKFFVPDAIQHYPIITPRVNVLVGEEKKRKFDWSVEIINPDTLSKIKEDKKRLVDQKLMEMLQSDVSDEELEQELMKYGDYINFDYQDLREKRANLLMKNYISKLNMKYLFQKGFKDALIFGEEIYMFDIINGNVTFERLNPTKVHTLRSGSSNKIEDSDIIVLDDFWSPGKIQDTYYSDLSELQVKELDDEVTTPGANDKNLDGMSEAVEITKMAKEKAEARENELNAQKGQMQERQIQAAEEAAERAYQREEESKNKDRTTKIQIAELGALGRASDKQSDIRGIQEIKSATDQAIAGQKITADRQTASERHSLDTAKHADEKNLRMEEFKLRAKELQEKQAQRVSNEHIATINKN